MTRQSPVHNAKRRPKQTSTAGAAVSQAVVLPAGDLLPAEASEHSMSLPQPQNATPRPSRRDRERQNRRREILAGAKAVFAEKGYVRSTLEEIALRSEFGKGTLYNYFPDGKQEILFAVFDEIYEDLHALTETLLARNLDDATTARSTFRNYMLQMFRYFDERQDLFMILIKEAHRLLFADDEKKAAYFVMQRMRLVNALVVPIEHAMNAGAIRTMDPTAVAHAILGNVNGCQVHACLESECGGLGVERHTPEYNADFLMTLIFDGLLQERVAQPKYASL